MSGRAGRMVAYGSAALALLVSATSGAPIKNVIIFIGDGMGPEHVKAGRFYQGSNLVFELFSCQSSMTTYCSNGVTDSAAAATAIATGRKVYSGVISMANPGDLGEMQTLLEYFQLKGKRAGLVTTTSMSDATPAAFGAHELDRDSRAAIVNDYFVQTRPNILFGGGGSGMTVAGALAAGYVVVTNRVMMQALDTETNVMVSGVFGDTHLPYEAAGMGGLPHLREMTYTALRILDNDPDGFFLMVEGGLIDTASHAGDIASVVPEVIELGKAVQEGLNWASGRTDTLILVTADHETAGLVITNNNGPGVLPGVKWTEPSKYHTDTNVGVYAWGLFSEKAVAVTDNTEIAAMVKTPVLTVPTAALISGATGDVRTAWSSVTGDVYRLEYATNLMNSSWSPMGTSTAATSALEFRDTNLVGNAARFYRLIPIE